MWSETVEQTNREAQAKSDLKQIQTAAQTDGIHKVQGGRGVRPALRHQHFVCCFFLCKCMYVVEYYI